MSLLGYPKIIPYTKFGNFAIIRFWVMHAPNINTLVDHLTSTFDLSTLKPCQFYDIPRSFPTPSLNALRSFLFELCCGQTDRQIQKQTASNIYIPTPIVGMDNDWHVVNIDTTSARMPINITMQPACKAGGRYAVHSTCKARENNARFYHFSVNGAFHYAI